MHCTNCGAALQPGVALCQNCGAPVSQTPVNQSLPSYDPTIVAPPYNPPQNAQTAYGANIYGGSQPGGTQYDPYGSTPANPYPPANPYGSNGYAQPVSPPPNYGYPQAQPQGAYIPPVPGAYNAIPPQLPKKRSNVGLIIGIVVGGLLLLCVGLGVVFAIIGSQASKTTNSSTKSTNLSAIPSGKSVVSSAAAILHNPQTSSDVDKDYNPKNVTSTFTTSQSVYLTFDIDSGNNDGYVQAKWYADGQIVSTKSFTHSHTNNFGFFSRGYTSPTSNGAAELYWCTKADCSDAQLAQVVHFTVTNASLVPSGSNVALLHDAHRRVV